MPACYSLSHSRATGDFEGGECSAAKDAEADEWRLVWRGSRGERVAARSRGAQKDDGFGLKANEKS